MEHQRCPVCDAGCAIKVDIDITDALKLPGRAVWPGEVPAALSCRSCDWSMSGVMIGLEVEVHVHFEGQPDEVVHASMLDGEFSPRMG